MHQENGSTVNNSSERELNQETQNQSSTEIGNAYIPYSQRHSVKSQNIGKFLNYLERIIGIDLEECILQFDVSGDHESVMIWFQNGRNLSINSIGVCGADGQEENGKQKSIFFVMESRAFFQIYEAVFPTIKHCFIS